MTLIKGETDFYVSSHALINKDGKYLVIKRAETENYMPLKWDVPRGTIDAGEDTITCLQREVLEEAGLKVEIDRLIFAYTNLDGFPKHHVVHLVYLCNYVSGEVRLEPTEHSEYKWLTKEEIKDLDTIAFLNALTKDKEYNKL